MPPPPPAVTNPYDMVDTVLNMARVRLNDAISGIAGDVLADTQSYTQTYVNAAWRRIQNYLRSLGYKRFINETIITGIPVVATADQSSQPYLNWQYCFDGVNWTTTPCLPQDLIQPTDLWERVSGTTGLFIPMDEVYNGLPADPKGFRNKLWEWRDDTLYLLGSLVSMDIRMRYESYHADFKTAGGTQWYQQQVPIMRCSDALAWAICAEVSRARGDVDANTFDSRAQEACLMILDREIAGPKSVLKPSEHGKMPDTYTARMGNPPAAGGPAQ